MNYLILLLFTCALLSSRCRSVPVEDSVVSVYTTQPTTAGPNVPLDVYYQIANNLAEKITSPIYRFLGYNTTTVPPDTKMAPVRTSSVEYSNLTTKSDVEPVDNDIGKTREVEEVTPDGTKPQKKPEKFTLYSSLASSYLPSKLQDKKTLKNNIFEDIDDDDSFKLDDVDLGDPPSKPREGPMIYILEWLGSIFQLLWSGLSAILKPSSKSY